MSSLDAIRSKLQKNTQGRAPSSTSSGDLYPFWNAPTGSTTVLRFLKDADEDNVYFWRERQMINMKFASVEGHPELGEVTIKVPCIEMYGTGERCPVLAETRPWWKTDKEEYARRFWPQKTYIYQGFVREGHINEEAAPENPIRRFVISKSIHKIIEASLMDVEMENIPSDVEHGTDFKIVKQQDGKFASYATSSFARRESALTVSEREAVDQYGLFDLSGFLPRRPTEEDLQVIYQMFLESMKDDESVYRLEWASHYKPYNLKLDGTESAAPQAAAPAQQAAPQQSAPAAQPVQEEEAPVASGGSNNTDDILAQLRSRINK